MKKLSLVFILFLTCTYLEKRIAIKNCKFYFKDVKIERIGLKDIDLKTFIEIKNPNSIEVVMEKFTYDFYVNNINAFSGIFSQKTEIESGKSKTINMLVNIPYDKITQAILSLIKEDKADYKIKGRVYFSTILGEFPFDVEIEK